jgi:hypothetical protein
VSLDDEPKANLPDAAGGLRAAAGVNGSINNNTDLMKLRGKPLAFAHLVEYSLAL